ncbi:MAG: OmpA family protein [Ignavibacteriae bacterium]|nr:OmpA family protein [Ignavibacteriota bacterium]
MKHFLLILFLLFLPIKTFQLNAQFNVLEKVKKKANKTIEKNIDEQINKTVDGAEKEIKKESSMEKDKSKNKNNESIENSDKEMENTIDGTEKKMKIWRKYDFVSGDKIIFADDLIGEQVGEFPSKWDLVYGNAETVKFGDLSVIGFMQKQTKVIPFMDKEDYLPEVFTIEFDFYYYGKYNEAYVLHFDNSVPEINIRTHRVSMKNFVGEPGDGAKDTGWHHFALSFNKRALKAYYDQTRVLNVPRLKTKPTSFSISALSSGIKKGDPAIIKNIRVAEGGVKLYDRVLSEGKFVTRGILFDVNKASIKPESMGAINNIVKMLQEHSVLNFSIEGHTDSDGEDDYNQILSEERAESVKNMLVSLGIDSSRLSIKGFGESVPVDKNTDTEGKANNRRVEFVKI